MKTRSAIRATALSIKQVTAFWDERYRANRTPWDLGACPAEVVALARGLAPGSRVLIPGCGSGYEIAAFAAAGADVTAVDLSPAAIERARRQQAAAARVNLLTGDFFRLALPAGGFDVVYERTFLCALPPSLWPDYRRRMLELLRPGGGLVGFFYFAVTEPADGPPFGLPPGAAEELFAAPFRLERDEDSPGALPLFAGRERWQVRRRG